MGRSAFLLNGFVQDVVAGHHDAHVNHLVGG